MVMVVYVVCRNENRIETRRLIRFSIRTSIQCDTERSKPRFVADMTANSTRYCNTHLR